MKTKTFKIWQLILLISAILFFNNTSGQEQKNSQILDQNISIYAENESLSDLIKKICEYLNID